DAETGGRGGVRHPLDGRGRRPHGTGRAVPARDLARRASPALERDPRRHEPRRPAPGTPPLRGAVLPQLPRLHAAPPRAGRDDGLGAGPRVPRRHVHRVARQARQLLHRPLVVHGRLEDPAADRAGDGVQGRRMSDCAPAFAWSETARAMQPSQGLRPSRARAAAPARPGGLGWGTRPAWAARAARAAFRRPSWLVAAVVLSVGVPSGSPVFGPGLQIGPGDVASVALVLAAALLLATGRAWLPRAVLPAFGPMAAAVAVGTMCSTSVESSLPGFVRNVQLFVLVPVAVVALVRDRRDLAIVCSSL